MNHAELVKRAENWLRNTFHCRVVLTELVAYTNSCETPDAIGWVHNKSILVECKANRADFLTDKKKFSRQSGVDALGHWRFYLTPVGIILPYEILEGWGVYEVHGKRIVHFSGSKHSNAAPPPFASDRESEVAMLVSALGRVTPEGKED